MIGIISWIIFGLIAGALAKWLMPGPDPDGWFITLGLGVGGAFLGGFLASFVGLGGDNGFIINLLVAIGGAMLLLAIWRMIKSNS